MQMLSTQYITFQKSLINKKCEQQDSFINPFADLLFNEQKKSIPQPFSFPNTNKSKPTQTVVSLKNQIIQWFKSLNNQQKSDVTTIKDKQFLCSFLKYTSEEYNHRQIHFTTGHTIANLFPNNSLQQKFNYVKEKINIALTGQPIMYINFEQNFLTQKFIQWLQQVTDHKIFQYANKITNKQISQENCLWFNSSSFHTLDEWFVNEIEKSVVKNYFKKDQIQNYKIKQLKEFMGLKYPNEVKYYNLTLQQARKLTKEQIQTTSNLIKTYENYYYDNIRQNVIQSLEILENQKDSKKKRKNKRKTKTKKKGFFSPKNHSFIQQEINSAHKKIHCHSDTQKNQQISQDDQQNIALMQTVIEQVYQKQDNQQSTREFQIQQLNNQEDPILSVKNKSQRSKKKLCKSKQETHTRNSNMSNQKRSKQTNCNNNKNLVIKRDRSMSPHTKSNTLDNDCSKSMLSGEFYETFTEAITDECTVKNEQFELENFEEQMIENSQYGEQNRQNKKRRKRKNNNTNRYLQEMVQKASGGLINKHLTNFIDNLSIETNNLYESKVICFERVRYFIKTLFPQTEAVLFGSNAIGLSLPTSDVDIMLHNIPIKSRDQVKDILAQIAIQINSYAWIVSCSTYLNAKAPLVKLEIDPTICYFEMKRRSDYQIYDPMVSYYLDIKDRKKAKNINVDLTINLQNMDTYMSPSTQLMRSYVNEDSTLQRMVLVFKYILAQKSYNKNFNGGLGSYCLFIMVAAYFNEFKSSLPQDQGEIFLNILKFYSEEFQNKLKSITLREQGGCFISLQESLNIAKMSEIILSNPLRIIDPLSFNIMSSSCSQYNCIKSEFRRIRTEILQQFQNIEKELSSNYTATELAKLVANQKTIQKWIHKYENRRRFSIKKILDGKTQNQ